MLERPQLGVGGSGRGDLLRQQLGASAVEPVQLEHEAAEVAKLDLAQLAQISGAPADAAARGEGRRLRGGAWSGAVVLVIVCAGAAPFACAAPLELAMGAGEVGVLADTRRRRTMRS